MAIARDTKVRFTSSKLGVLDPENPNKFHPDIVVEDGDFGWYVEEHPRESLQEQDWHICRIDRLLSSYEVPVHSSHFETITYRG